MAHGGRASAVRAPNLEGHAVWLDLVLDLGGARSRRVGLGSARPDLAHGDLLPSHLMEWVIGESCCRTFDDRNSASRISGHYHRLGDLRTSIVPAREPDDSHRQLARAA